MWEVSLVHDTAARRVIASDVTGGELEAAFLLALGEAAKSNRLRTPAVLVQRTDRTPEALKAKWFSDFYDITRSGAKRRRYKKPAIEAQWEQWVKDQRKLDREARALSNVGRGSGRLNDYS